MAYCLSGPPTGGWTLTYTEISPAKPDPRVEKATIYWQADKDACELLYLAVIEEPWARLCQYVHVYAISPSGERHKLE